MKKFSLIFLFALLFFLVGCGGGNDNGYDTYDESGSSQKNDSDADSNQNDSDKQEQNGNDAKTPETENGDDSDISGTENNDEDNGSGNSGGFWSTCEGIIACTTGCLEEDYDCFDKCVSRGSDDGTADYRAWRQCFEEKCAEDKTPECSAAQCAEFDEKCNVAEALEYELTIPAPYGEAVFGGDFSYILNNTEPTSDNQINRSSFAQGNISTMPINPDGLIISFAKTTRNERDGSVVEVYQAPVDKNSMKSGNPVVILSIKQDSAVAGEHSVGVADESEARFIVADIDSKSDILCYHAFGIGKFTIDEASIQTGSDGKLKFSSGTVELFHPENIPELGGDAREILGVVSCSLIDY